MNKMLIDEATVKLALEALIAATPVKAKDSHFVFENAIFAIKEALSEHAMQEVQRLGQEIEAQL